MGPWSFLDDFVYHNSLLPGNAGSVNVTPVGASYARTLPAATAVWTGDQWYLLPADLTVNFTGATRAGWAYPQTTGTLDVNMVHTSRTWMFKPLPTGNAIYTTLRSQLAWIESLWYVAAGSPSVPAWRSSPSLFSSGDARLGNEIVPRAKTIQDLSCAEVWRQACASKPDLAFWWQYEAELGPTPQLNGQSAKDAEAMPLRQEAIQDHSVALNDESMPTGVVVRWEDTPNPTSGMGRPRWADFFPGSTILRNPTATIGSNMLFYTANTNVEVGMMVAGTGIAPGTVVAEIISATQCRLNAVTIGSVAGSRRVIVARRADGTSCLLSGVLVHTVTDDLPIIHGLAEDVYRSLESLRPQGQVTLHSPDGPGDWRPGQVLTLPDPMLRDARCLVQSTTWTAATGQTTLTLGPPSHLSLRDRADLYGWLQVSLSGPFWTRTWVVPAP